MVNAMVSGHLRSCLGRRHKTRHTTLTHWLSQWFHRAPPPVSARVTCQRATNLLATAKAAERQAQQAEKSAKVPVLPTKCRRLLLLGSPTDEQKAIKQLWESLNFEVMTARSSLGVITNKPFSLCDYVLIDVEGLQESATVAISRLASYLKHDEDCHTQLIALTEFFDQQSADLLRAGAHHCFAKPLTAQPLVDLLPIRKPVLPEPLPVLLLEDDPAQQHVMAFHLKRAKQSVTLAKTVTEACHHIRTTRYGFIITDMGLPDGEGLTLIKMARHHSDSQNRQTPIIAVTANAEDFRESCLAAGAEGVYAKPVSAAQIAAWLAQYVAGAKQTGE